MALNKFNFKAGGLKINQYGWLSVILPNDISLNIIYPQYNCIDKILSSLIECDECRRYRPKFGCFPAIFYHSSLHTWDYANLHLLLL